VSLCRDDNNLCVYGRVAAMIKFAERARIWILCAGFGLFVPLGLLAKQSMATVYIATAVLVLVTAGVSNPRSLLPNRSLALAFSALVVYVGTTHFYVISCEPCLAVVAGKLAMLGLLLWASSASVVVLDAEARRKVGLALILGLAAALLLLVGELSNDASIYRALSGRQNDTDVPLFRYNRGSSALVLLAWPAAAWLWSRPHQGWRWGLGLIVVSIAAAGYGDSASALVSGIVGLVVAAAAILAPSVTFFIGVSATAAFTLLSPFLFIRLLGWVQPISGDIPPSVLDRIEIWHHSATTVLDAPLLGHGIGAIRHLPLPVDPVIPYQYLVKAPTHPHDAAIQLWLELGAVGLVIFIIIVWLAVRTVRGLQSPWQVAATGAGAALAFTAMVSYGLWQETWLGIIGMMVLGFRVLVPSPGKP
jgi:exopolysaccharide production protein ExoQ